MNFSSLTPAQQQAFLHGPALRPPPGVVPQFHDPPNQNSLGIALVSVSLALTSMGILIRVYSRLVCVKQVRIEDLLGLGAVAGYVTLIWALFRFRYVVGYFVHQWNVQVIQMSDVSYILFIIPQAYSVCLLFAKAAILLEWNRIFVPHRVRNWFFWTAVTVICLNTALYIASITAANFYCRPQAKIWNRWIDGTCLERKDIDAPPAAFNFLFDIIILLLPQKVIWKLHMSKSRKIGLSFMFSVGLFASASAAARFGTTLQLNYAGDVTYGVCPALLWAIAECSCVLLVFCIPAFPKTFSHFSQIATSWRSFTGSWLTSSSAPRPISDNEKPTARPFRNMRSTDRRYRNISHDGEDITLTDLEAGIPVQHAERPSAPIKETDIRVERMPASDSDDAGVHQRQHPWQ